MTLEIDLEQKTLRASVRALIEDALEVPRPAGPLAFARQQLGTDVHRQVRQEREQADASYEGEVSLTGEFEVAGFAVRLRGRADGIATEDSLRIVEEVKSIDQPGRVLASARPTDHADATRQATLYALCLSQQEPDAEIAARLVLVSIVDGARQVIDLPFDVDRARRVLERLVRRRIRAATDARTRARLRARAAASLRFPYDEARAHQQAFTDTIEEGLATQRPVLAMAPTGIGKTVGALLPALRHALEHDAILFFLTARNTQQALVARTFEDVAAAVGQDGASLRALTVREKRGMCPPGTLLCHPDHCPYLVGFLDKTKREAVVDELLEAGAHIHPDAILDAGETREVCPYATALALSLRVDLVICDVNYAYDPSVSLGHFQEDARGRDAVVVIDEAHNLFDRAREYYSPFVNAMRVRDLLTAVREEGESGPQDLFASDPSLQRDLASHLERLGKTIRQIASAAAEETSGSMDGCRPVSRPQSAWDEVAGEASRLMVRYAHHQQANGNVTADDEMLSLFAAEHSVRALLAVDEKEFVPYVSTSREGPEGAGFGILCVNPAGRLAERHARLVGTIAMSATLHPLDYYRDVLGFETLEPLEVELPSPFPEEHRCVAVLPDVATTWRERRQHYERIARHIETVVHARPGNYVAYFPSFRFLEDVRAHLSLDADAVLVQSPRMSPDARVRLLERLADPANPTLLLAVMGGVFAEGIDLPGDALIGAIIVGPSLPQVGFERALMQHYFDEKVQRGFAYAMLFPGMQRVIQSAGRVHRTPEDRGVIVLLGRRFLASPYVDCLPSTWYRYDPRDLETDDLESRLAAFWESAGVGDPVLNNPDFNDAVLNHPVLNDPVLNDPECGPDAPSGPP